MKSFDVAIIGGGPGGYVAAIRAAQLGMKVAVIDERPRLGGTCLNVGCIPSKTLLYSTELFATVRDEGAEHGILVNSIKVDFPQMMRRKEAVVEGLGRGIDALMRKNKIDRIEGRARLTGPTTLEVNGESLTARSIVLAMGSESTPLPFLPFDEQRVLSSTGALSLTTIPKKLTVVGAGVIGLELGSVYRRLGTEVTFVEFMDTICPVLDKTLSSSIHKTLTHQGLIFHLSSKVVSGAISDRAVTLQVEKGDGSKLTLESDAVLVAVGRRPVTRDTGLDKLGIQTDKQGRILVDGYFRTAIPSIYAIGDLIEGPMLAHKASEEGIAVAEIIAGMHPHINYLAIPNVVYTSPEVATVGMTEEEARKAGLNVVTGSFPFKANSRALCTDRTDGLVKIVAEADGDHILGVHIIAEHASEMIGEAVVAIAKRMKVKELALLSHAHPTFTEAIKEAALAVHKEQLHL